MYYLTAHSEDRIGLALHEPCQKSSVPSENARMRVSHADSPPWHTRDSRFPSPTRGSRQWTPCRKHVPRYPLRALNAEIATVMEWQVPSETHHGSNAPVTSQRSELCTGGTRSRSEVGVCTRPGSKRRHQFGFNRKEQVNPTRERNNPGPCPHELRRTVFFSHVSPSRNVSSPIACQLRSSFSAITPRPPRGCHFMQLDYVIPARRPTTGP